MKIAIIDYGMGNVNSITSILKFIGVQNVQLSSSIEILEDADKIILPGVGSFGSAIKKIRNDKIDKLLYDLVTIKKKPILGICLGMQLLCNSSNEEGFNKGLGFINGDVTRFIESENLKIPHVGFDQVEINKNSKLFKGIENNADFYFTHSYKILSNENSILFSTCNYGEKFIAAFEFENIAGVQFHPELSQTNGIQLFNNFINSF
jgi:glutamine amidotransferase